VRNMRDEGILTDRKGTKGIALPDHAVPCAPRVYQD
jgi:hypothetical protein